MGQDHTQSSQQFTASVKFNTKPALVVVLIELLGGPRPPRLAQLLAAFEANKRNCQSDHTAGQTIGTGPTNATSFRELCPLAARCRTTAVHTLLNPSRDCTSLTDKIHTLAESQWRLGNSFTMPLHKAPQSFGRDAGRCSLFYN